MTMRCCGEMRGVSQPEVARVAMTRLGLGSMLAVDEERRERAVVDISFVDWRVGEEEWEGVLLSAME